MDIKGLKIGVCICGSFCTFKKAIGEFEKLKEKGADLRFIMSYNATGTDTRFGRAADFKNKLREISEKAVIETLPEAEPIGPENMCDVLVVCPCTGNTLAKLNNGITDTPVTLAVKSHLRNEKPVVLAIATNDGLSGNFQNIGQLLNKKNIYFVPFGQDNSKLKPMSLMADFSKIEETVSEALYGRQIQSLLL
ncbi:MAG: dipicolinate synthase subunit B [Clostridiales bacterium]|nr:dipicolinate synthase subunit B [Clostridiales bacterium]